MNRLFKLLALALVVPAVVVALGLWGRARWEAGWDPLLGRQLAVQRTLPYGGLLVRPTLAAVCGDQRLGARFAPCVTYNLFSTAIGASAVAGGAELLLLGALLLAGRWCRGNRRRITRLFHPLLVAGAAAVSSIGVANGLLAALGVALGAAAMSLQPPDRELGPFLFLPVWAGLAWGASVGVIAFGMIRRERTTVIGQTLDLAGQPSLSGVIREVSAAVGAEPPVNVVACLVPWLFVTEMDVVCLDGRVSGRTLCLSIPLARILSIDELRGQLAHELAHFSPEQAPFTRRVALPLVAVSRALRDAAGRSRGLRSVVGGPALAVLSMLVGEIVAGDVPDGDRERAADAAAAAAAGREAFGSGLVKVAAFTPSWHGVFAIMQHAAYSGAQYVNAGEVFQEIVASNSGGERLAGVEASVQGHPTDRHSTLGERLGALGIGVRDVAGSALMTLPQRSGASLVEGRESIERRLSAAEHQLILETGGRIARG